MSDVQPPSELRHNKGALHDCDRHEPGAGPAQRGEQHAATEFIRATQADVWRFLAHLSSRELADDLTQDTYLRAFGALASYRGEAAARTWLLAIARRVAADHLRRENRRPRPAGADSDQAVAAAPDPAGAVAAGQLVDQLDPEPRAAFVLTQLLGFSYAEAAEICGCPIGTIRSRVARAREHLVAALRGEPAADAGPAARSAVRRARRL